MSALDPYFAALRDGDASALLLRAGDRPRWRVGGELVPNGDPLPPTFDSIALDLLRESGHEPTTETGDVEWVVSAAGARFRACCYRAAEGLTLVLNKLPDAPAELGTLGIPDALTEACNLDGGLVLICGPSGSGRTTTLTALVGEINARRARHIMTLEQPIEHVLKSCRSVVHQLEVGRDTPSFAAGIRTALTAGAEVLAVGGVPDRETAALTLRAADSGILVFAVLPGHAADDALVRLTELLPERDRALVLAELAVTLRLVHFQQLVPTRNGRLALVTEVVPGGPELADLVRRQAMDELPELFHGGLVPGLHSIEDSLVELVNSGQLDRDQAGRWVRDRAAFENRARR